MVGAAAATDAVALARTMPGLGVGLHLVLVDGVPVLPVRDIPDLVGRDGRFCSNMALAGVNFLRPRVRRQLAGEITAQFEAFAATGLPLDHVNAHKHFHLHPVVASSLLEIGPRFGMRSVRAPVEPWDVIRLAKDDPPPAMPGDEDPDDSIATRLAVAFARRLAQRLRRAHLRVPDAVFGLRWTGQMTAERLCALLPVLPPGLVEIYAHPSTRDDFPGHAPGAAHMTEFAGLVDPQVRAAVVSSGARLSTFAAA